MSGAHGQVRWKTEIKAVSVSVQPSQTQGLGSVDLIPTSDLLIQVPYDKTYAHPNQHPQFRSTLPNISRPSAHHLARTFDMFRSNTFERLWIGMWSRIE